MSIEGELKSRIEKARARYGDFASTHEALGVALEEWEELKDAVRANAPSSVYEECLDLAAVLIRLAESLDNEAVRLRSVK